MAALLSRFWFSLRFTLLAASVLLVLGLNQRAVSVLRLPAQSGRPQLAPQRATVVKQKVLLEATTSLTHFVAPLPVAWLPQPAFDAAWRGGQSAALTAAALPDGLSAGHFYRARLLAVALSPQAP